MAPTNEAGACVMPKTQSAGLGPAVRWRGRPHAGPRGANREEGGHQGPAAASARSDTPKTGGGGVRN